MSFVASVRQPSTLRMLIWPEASNAQNGMAAVSARGLFAGRPRLLYIVREETSWSASLPQLVVVSNRVSVPDAAGKGTAGGLAVALREGISSLSRSLVRLEQRAGQRPSLHPSPRMVDKGRVQYALMDLTSLDRQEYYNGFANRALWPTMHYRVGLSDFSRADYAGYLRVNRTFASALAKLVCPATSCGCTTII